MNRQQALAELASVGKQKDEAIRIIVTPTTDEQGPIYVLTLTTVLDVLKIGRAHV